MIEIETTEKFATFLLNGDVVRVIPIGMVSYKPNNANENFLQLLFFEKGSQHHFLKNWTNDGISVNGEVLTPENYIEKLSPLFITGGDNPSTPMRKKYKWAMDVFDKHPSTTKRILIVLNDGFPTFQLNAAQLGNAGCSWTTSDGATYNTNTAHTWDSTKDIKNPSARGYIRWIIVHSANANVMCNLANALNRNCIFAYFGNNANLTGIIFSNSNETLANRRLEAVLHDGTATAPQLSIDAFNGCTGLAEIMFPNNITTLGARAMRGNVSMTRVIVLPESITTIGADCFSFSRHLTKIIYGNRVNSLGLVVNNSIRELHIPRSVTTIQAFVELLSLNSLKVDSGYVLPSNINLSSAYAFPERAAVLLGQLLGVTSVTRIITFGTAILNRYSDETKAIFTQKGYSLA